MRKPCTFVNFNLTISPFALSLYHFLNFKLSVESTQSQPLQDICL